jgi:phosphoenolpyruvate carboxykinase (ATP)
MLGEKLRQHKSRVWLVNTGWSGGPYGVGTRMKLAHTRAMVRAALSGELNAVTSTIHPVFGVAMPITVRDVPADVLNPRSTWSDRAAYDAQAKKLAEMFKANIAGFTGLDETVRAAGPRV